MTNLPGQPDKPGHFSLLPAKEDFTRKNLQTGGVRPVVPGDHVAGLISQCADVGVSLRVIRGKIQPSGPLPTQIREALRSVRDDVVRRLCPEFETNEAYEEAVFSTAAQVMAMFPHLRPEIEEAMFSTVEHLAMTVADLFWKEEGL